MLQMEHLCGITQPVGEWNLLPLCPRALVFVGSTDHNVYALNDSTGALVWNYTTGGYVDSGPAVANGWSS